VALTGTINWIRDPEGILSLEAMPENQPISPLCQEYGFGSQSQYQLLFFKPENWEVTFKPEKIDALEPNALKQIGGHD